MTSATLARDTTAIRPQTLAYAGLVLAACAWAAAFIAGKVVLREMTPYTTAFWRYAAAVMALAPWAWVSRPSWEKLRPVVAPLFIMAVGGGALYQGLFLVALQKTTATNTSLLIALNPVFTLLLSPLVGQPLHRRSLGGVALALLGAAIVITHGNWEQAAAVARLSTGDLLALAAAACWAAVNVASQRVVGVLSPSFSNGVIFGIGAVVLAFLARDEQPIAQLSHASLPAIVGILVMGLGSSVLAGHLFLSGVLTLGVSRSVMFIYFVPVLTALSSVLLLGEPFYAAQGIGGVAVLCGVYWANRK